MSLPGVGDRVEDVRFITQASFDAFAELSGDDNPIHVDPVFSARTRFGRTVAHGMFLFGSLAALAARWLGGPVHVLDQQMRFSAPTFAGEEMAMHMEVVARAGASATVSQRIERPDGVVTLEGTATLARSHPTGSPIEWEVAPTAARFKRLRPGATAESVRVFSAREVEAYVDLVDDPNDLFARGDQVPPALLAGVVSRLLGTEVPGPGTNWLKQHYRFHADVGTDVAVETSVAVRRLRPEKALVDLSDLAVAGGATVMTGRSLVLAADVAD